MNKASSIAPFWEQTYQDLTTSTFGKPSVEIVELADTLPRGAAVLDLGCGEGRNALFLAERGFDVTAVDLSEHGIAKVRAIAERGGFTIRAQMADMRTYELDREYDLIISHGCLHLIERENWAKVLQRFKTHTRLGGYNVVAVFTDRIAPPPDLEAFCLGLFREGELFTHYADWAVTLQKSYTIHDEHPGGIRHTHPIDKVVARKHSNGLR
jgi:tellurite methyltransferase